VIDSQQYRRMIQCFCFRIFVLKQHLAKLCLICYITKLKNKRQQNSAPTTAWRASIVITNKTNTFLNILDRFPGLTGLHLPWGVEPLQDELITSIPSPPIAHVQIVASLFIIITQHWFLAFLFESLPLSVSPSLFIHISMGHSSYCCSQVQ
jgi:hypothetical protein